MPSISFERVHWSRFLITFASVVLLVCLSWFAWKVYTYAKALSSGEALAQETFSSSRATVDAILSSLEHADLTQGTGSLVTDDDPSIGSVDAPVTIVAFVDYGCPYSQDESMVFEALAHNLPDVVRVIFRDYPLTDLHPGADLAAVASECASEQGKFPEMYHALNAQKGVEFTDELLVNLAVSLGMNEREYKTCVASGYYQDEIAGDTLDGVAAGVEATPTLFLNGLKIEGAVPYGILYEALQALAR